MNGAILSAAARLAGTDSIGLGGGGLAQVERLLRAWFEERARLVHPAPFLSGHEITDILTLESGPAIGRLLRSLKEAQVLGQVSTREEAIAYLHSLADQCEPDA